MTLPDHIPAPGERFNGGSRDPRHSSRGVQPFRLAQQANAVLARGHPVVCSTGTACVACGQRTRSAAVSLFCSPFEARSAGLFAAHTLGHRFLLFDRKLHLLRGATWRHLYPHAQRQEELWWVLVEVFSSRC